MFTEFHNLRLILSAPSPSSAVDSKRSKLFALQFLDLSFDTPARNLAADEHLLIQAENGARGPTLRFWESTEYFVALGYTNRAETEANLPACAAQNVPVLRRVSGGGTVMQGPGCLNYALVHPIAPGQTLNVEATNKLVMETQRAAFEKLLGEAVSVAGHTDLATGDLKFSGNAQRRKARNFLFHGTILLDLDLELVQRLLRPPSKEPEYRANRSHREFIRNLPVSREEVKNALRAAWNADDVAASVEAVELDELIAERYGRDEWNLKF